MQKIQITKIHKISWKFATKIVEFPEIVFEMLEKIEILVEKGQK